MGNSLDYGLYKFEFYFEQFFVYQGQHDSIQVIREAFISIIPTQIAVFGVEAGVSEMEIGYAQALTLGYLIFILKNN